MKKVFQKIILSHLFVFSTQTAWYWPFGESTPTAPEPVPVQKPQHVQMNELSKIMLSHALNRAHDGKEQNQSNRDIWGNSWRQKYIIPGQQEPNYCTRSINSLTGFYPDIICWWISVLKKRDYETLQNLDFKNRILFYGPPGNGKTLIASTIAKIANAEFIAISTPAIVKRYIGDGVKTLEELKQRIENILHKKIKLEDGTETTDTTTPIIIFSMKLILLLVIIILNPEQNIKQPCNIYG